MVEEQFILSLLQLPRVGRKTAAKALMATRRTPSNAREFFDQVSSEDGLQLGIREAEAKDAWNHATSVLDRCRDLEIEPLATTRPEFPQWLKSIPDAPLILFMKGNTSCVKNPLGFAVIGTREPTEYGVRVAHRLGQRGAEAGCVVISGLAIGCDSAGHRGCLDANGQTVAVMAHGLDQIYPKESRPLASEILEKNGCLVSEYAPGVRAQRSYFVERDRLQSGLSSGVAVVETDTDGGTMHTVRFAEAQGRPLACLAHPLHMGGEEKTRGNALLLSEKRARGLAAAVDLSNFINDVRKQAEKWSCDGSTGTSQAFPSKKPERDLFSGSDENGGNPF